MTDKTSEETMNLDWAEMTPTLWMTFLPTIPCFTGFMQPRVNTAAEVVKQGDSWVYQIDVAVKDNEDGINMVFLTNQDFNIPNTATAREMKQKVGQLTIEQIKSKLREKGYEPAYQW